MKSGVLFILIIALISCKSNELHKNASIGKDAMKATLTSNSSITSDPRQYPYAATLKDLHQQEVKSNDVLVKKNQPTVVMFWLTTCGPCARELRSINDNFSEWQQQVPFNLVAMSEDRDENFPAILERIRIEKWPFISYWDFNRDLLALMPTKYNGLPQTFIFDKNGKLTFSKRGYLPGDETSIFEKIKEAAKS